MPLDIRGGDATRMTCHSRTDYDYDGVTRLLRGAGASPLDLRIAPNSFPAFEEGPPMSFEGSITLWIGRLKSGDAAAAQRLWEAYFRRMVGLARQRLRDVPRRAADEEDVALSAFNSFCAGARANRFPLLADRHNLWPLLVSITAHKCVDLIRRETRQKRGGPTATTPLSDFDQLLGREPTPEFAAQVAEELECRLRRLDRTGDTDLRPIALAKLAGESTAAIAGRLGCVRRTVERKLNLIARLWSEGDQP